MKKEQKTMMDRWANDKSPAGVTATPPPGEQKFTIVRKGEPDEPAPHDAEIIKLKK